MPIQWSVKDIGVVCSLKHSRRQAVPFLILNEFILRLWWNLFWSVFMYMLYTCICRYSYLFGDGVEHILASSSHEEVLGLLDDLLQQRLFFAHVQELVSICRHRTWGMYDYYRGCFFNVATFLSFKTNIYFSWKFNKFEKK